MLTDAGVSQGRLARESAVDAGYLSRIVQGLERPSLDVLARLSAGLGADLSVRIYPNTGPAIGDRHQSAIAEALLAGRHPRWDAFAELAVRRPARGWIDLGIHDPRASVLVAVEIESQLRRLEQSLRWANAKAESLPSWEGWPRLDPEPSISSLLIVRETRANRAIAHEHRMLLRTALPAHPDDALAALTGTDPWPGRALLWATRASSSTPYRLVARR